MPQIKDLKTFQGTMNQDVDPRFMKAGDYIDALNIRLDKQGASFETMEKLTQFTPVDSEYTCIGLYPDEINDYLYGFYAGISSPDLILRYQIYTNTWVTVVSSAALNFNASKPITGFDVTEGFIFFTDNYNPPRMIDLSFDYTVPSSLNETYFNMAKVVPRSQPEINVLVDSSFESNNIVGKYFQFKYRFVFSNKQKSVFSPISDVAYSTDDYASPESTAGRSGKYNAIDIDLTGDGVMEFVEYVEVAARSGNFADFFLIKKLKVNSTFLAGGTQSFRFYNEGLYSPIALQESNQLFDDVPQLAASLTFINNRAILGDVTNGQDKVDVEYTVDVSYGDTIEVSTKQDTFTSRTILEGGTPFSRLWADGSVMEAFFGTGGGSGFDYDALREGDLIRFQGYSTGSTYNYSFGDITVVVDPGDTWEDIVDKLLQENFPHPWDSASFETFNLIDYNTTDGVGNTMFDVYLTKTFHEKTFKSGAWYNAGLQYFDGEGRTNGVQIQENSKFYIKTIGERGLTPGSYVGAGAATVSVNIISEAPDWAEYYKIVYSKANVYDFTLQLRPYQQKDVGDNVKFDISTIGDWNNDMGGNLNYVYEHGDMLRVIAHHHASLEVKNDWTNQPLDIEIIGTDSEYDEGDGRYSIIVPVVQSSYIMDADQYGDSPMLEIYRPSKEIQVEESLFTEALMNYNIYSSSGHYYHRGDTDQNSYTNARVSIEGDAYLKSRTDYPFWTGAIESKESAIFESYDISDYRESGHYAIGRYSAIINQEKSRRISTLMYSEKVIPNTDINNLNRFYPDVNFEEYNRSFGNIVILSNEGDHILMIQHDKASKVYVDKNIMYDNQGGSQLVGTQNSVVSAAMPYSGEYGIQNPHAYTHFGNRKYWVDRIRGVAVRLSQNGIEEISNNGMSTWFNDKCSGASENSRRIVATYDAFNDEVIFSFLDTNPAVAKSTIVFSEMKGGFTHRLGYDIRYAAPINNRLYLVGNSLYLMYRKDYSATPTADEHNLIGSTALPEPFIKFASNIEPDTLKNYQAIHIDGVYPMVTKVETVDNIRISNQETTMEESDFTKRETEWHASVLRDINTPNVSYPIVNGDTMKGKHAVITSTISDSYYSKATGRWTSIGVIVSEG